MKLHSPREIVRLVPHEPDAGTIATTLTPRLLATFVFVVVFTLSCMNPCLLSPLNPSNLLFMKSHCHKELLTLSCPLKPGWTAFRHHEFTTNNLPLPPCYISPLVDPFLARIGSLLTSEMTDTVALAWT